MNKNINLFKFILFFSIILFTNSKAELNNKIIITVGDEIITNYDMTQEFKYLNVITLGNFKTMNNKEAKRIAEDSLINDKIKVNALANYNNIIIRDELINNQILFTAQNLGFNNVEDLMVYLDIEEYKFEDLRNKIILELKWNQLVYQFYKNQIIVDKEKVDEELKKLVSKQKKNEEYLLYEIFIHTSLIKNEEDKDEKKIVEENNIKKNNEIVIEAESISYDGTKKNENGKESKKIDIDIEKNKQISIDEIIKSIEKIGFNNTAIQYSSSPNSQEGGRLGWINENDFSEILLKNIKGADVGKITKPINVPDGVIILKLENKRFEESTFDIDLEMKKIIEFEKNKQLMQFSSNFFNQFKNNIKIKRFDE